METDIQLALWNYFWTEVDEDKTENDQEIRTLKMLASIGYNTAFVNLCSHLGNCITGVEEKNEDEDTDSSTLDIDLKTMDLETLPDLSAFAADSQPAVYDCEVDSQGVVDVEYLTLPPEYERELLVLSSDEEDDSTSVEDTVCFAYNYGGADLENTVGWDRLGLLPDPWAEARHPTVEMLTSDDLTSDEIEPNLNILTLSSGLGNIALTPDLKGYGYTKLQLPSKGIKSVELLQYYPYLQYVDLANNNIEDLSPLWNIKHLVVLDLSKNNLTDGSIGKPDQIGFLTYLNLSHNKFNKIPDFSKCWAIKHFDLAHNRIEWIDHLSEFKYLSYLNLSHNRLEFIESLDNKLLMEINVSHNSIGRWENPDPKAIHSLENINISHNQLPTLTIFAEMYNLATLDVSHNNINAMSEFDALKTLPVVTNLKIAGNKISTIIPDPRRLIIYLLPSIKILDGVPITPMERVSAMTMFTSNPMHHRQSVRALYQVCSKIPTVGWEQFKQTGEHPALVVLIGDIGSSRKIIINRVQRMNPHICKEVKMLTTRPPVKNEATNSRMKNVSLKKFNRIESEGGFLVVERRLGHKWGVAVSELEDKNRVLLAFMGMKGSLEILWKGFNPTLIIMVPNQEEVLTKRCMKWFLSSDVYRTMFKVRRVTKRKKREGSIQGEDDYEDDEYGSSLRRKSSVPIRKSVKLIKCKSMFTSSSKKNWKITKYTENLGLNKKLLEECYGKYISGNPRNMRGISHDKRSSDRVFFKDFDNIRDKVSIL
ncbi:unnamed protein product [Nezara viridula]|uniref:Uncharacterized protein n=1 Tax=Nezara viridula TaxID=85310 RepID=A0A9P0HHJ6_NEZVI|nr:unnamed protein product [Nezara viridula]